MVGLIAGLAVIVVFGLAALTFAWKLSITTSIPTTGTSLTIVVPETESEAWALYMLRQQERQRAEAAALSARDAWLEACRVEEDAKTAWLTKYRAKQPPVDAVPEHLLMKLDEEVDAARSVGEASYKTNAKQ